MSGTQYLRRGVSGHTANMIDSCPTIDAKDRSSNRSSEVTVVKFNNTPILTAVFSEASIPIVIVKISVRPTTTMIVTAIKEWPKVTNETCDKVARYRTEYKSNILHNIVYFLIFDSVFRSITK